MTLFSGLCVTRSSEDTLPLASRSSWIHHVNLIAQQFHSGIQKTINPNWSRTKSCRLYPSLCCLYAALGEPKMIGSDTQSKSTVRFSSFAEQEARGIAVTRHTVSSVCKEIETISVLFFLDSNF